eukprot:1136728-Pelagomonas_calceolata.AAC.1
MMGACREHAYNITHPTGCPGPPCYNPKTREKFWGELIDQRFTPDFGRVHWGVGQRRAAFSWWAQCRAPFSLASGPYLFALQLCSKWNHLHMYPFPLVLIFQALRSKSNFLKHLLVDFLVIMAVFINLKHPGEPEHACMLGSELEMVMTAHAGPVPILQ